MRSILLLIALLTIDLFPTFGQTTIDRQYDGGWANTFWRFEFSKDGTFKWASRGHFGNMTKVGKYEIRHDTLEIVQGYENTAGTINRYYLIDGDSCIIDIKLRYAYCVLDPTQEWQQEDERQRNIKYPQKQTSNLQRIVDLDSVLTLCFNTPQVTKYFQFKKFKDRQPAILPYYEINGEGQSHFTIENKNPVFITKNNLTNDFYIEITDINEEEDTIIVEFRIPTKPVRFFIYSQKVSGKWALKSVHDYSF